MNSGILTTARLTITSTSAVPAASGLSGADEFDPSNTTYVQGTATSSAVQLFLEGGTKGGTASVAFAAPTGANFQDGFYYGNDEYGHRGLGSVGEQSSGCQYASFTVADVAYTGSTLTRLDLRFQTTCGYTSNVNADTFGELQLGEPEPSAGLMTNVRTGAWPDVAVGTRSNAIWPVWVRNTATSALTLGQLAEAGANPGDFPVASDGCSRRALAPHTACQIDLAFAPSAPNLRTASVTLPAGSTTLGFGVSGTGTPGITLLRMSSQPGDFVGGGLTYLITDAQEQMGVVDQMPGEFLAGIEDPSIPGDGWQVTVGSPTGVLSPGTHATNAIGNAGLYQLDVSGDGRGCGASSGTVTITQAAFDSDYAPTAVDITFRQTCAGSTAALTGEIEYHATTGAPAPPAPPTVYASDTFFRNVSDGFGTADPTGQSWIATTTAASALAVSPGHGDITVAPGHGSNTYLSGVSHTDLDVDATITLAKLPTGGNNGDYFYLYPRRVTSNEDYGVLARIDPAGHVYLTLIRDNGTTATATISPATYIGVTTANQAIHLRVEAIGSTPTTVRARGWLASTTEPSTWTVTTTDDTAGLQTTGTPAVANYLSRATTNGPITTTITGFVAQPPQ